MGCVIVSNGRVLSTAANYSRGTSIIDLNGHAEVRAIRKCNYCMGATLVIARINNRMSRPCKNCLKKIIEAGISRIVYQDWLGHTVVERISYVS
jgi:deoxycytidylate deaminase